MSTNEAGNLRSLDYIQIVHYSFARCYHCRKLGNTYMASLCTVCIMYESAIMSK